MSRIIFSVKPLFFIGLLFFVLKIDAQRIKQSINTSWQFHKGDNLHENDPGYWQTVNLPHTWNAEDVMDDEPGYYRGVGWYQKEIYIPREWGGKSVYIYFEGAGQVAEVFVNGKRVGEHIGAYLAFNFDISAFITPGMNKVKVKLDNVYNDDIQPLGGDFSVYGGIYRDVYLIATNASHFDMDNNASNGVFINTPEVSAKTASVHIKGKVTKSKALKVINTIYDANGKEVALTESKPDTYGNFDITFKKIANPILWTPETPYLYRVVTSLKDKAGNILDEVSNPLGFRWYRFEGDKGFFLNGKPYKIMGASRHQDFKSMGPALADALHVNDVQWLKDMGGNFLRISHYPQDPKIIEACDRLGILTAVETPGNNRITESEAFTTNTLNMQREMIRQYYNHPSVIIWSYMNEVLIQPRYDDNTPQREQYWKNLHDLAQKLEDLCREEDKERYTMVAYHGDYNRYKSVGLIDIPMIAGWNLYQGWYSGKFEDFETFVKRFHDDYPQKPVIISEFGADADYRLHNFTPKRFDKTQEYTNMYHEAYIKTIMKYEFISGAIIWNLVEFVNEGRQEAVPHVNNKGLLTTDRKPKDSYFIYKALLSQSPFVKIGGGNWTHRAQQADNGTDVFATQPVTVYTNGKTITLFHNGVEVAQKVVENRKVIFNIPFVNGKNYIRVITDKGIEDAIDVNFHVIANHLKSKENPFTTLNVSLGDKRMFMDDVTFEAWVPEKEYTQGNWGYTGGKIFKTNENDDRYGSTRNILGTAYDAMYETQRTGIDSFKADVPDGVYEVTLHFAELLSKEQQEQLVYNLESAAKETNSDFKGRVFNVLVNGQVFIENLSMENYLVPIHAYATKLTVSVINGEGISVNFDTKQGESILNGIQIRKIY